jgi:hypothetical protein
VARLPPKDPGHNDDEGSQPTDNGHKDNDGSQPTDHGHKDASGGHKDNKGSTPENVTATRERLTMNTTCCSWGDGKHPDRRVLFLRGSSGSQPTHKDASGSQPADDKGSQPPKKEKTWKFQATNNRQRLTACVGSQPNRNGSQPGLEEVSDQCEWCARHQQTDVLLMTDDVSRQQMLTAVLEGPSFHDTFIHASDGYMGSGPAPETYEAVDDDGGSESAPERREVDDRRSGPGLRRLVGSQPTRDRSCTPRPFCYSGSQPTPAPAVGGPHYVYRSMTTTGDECAGHGRHRDLGYTDYAHLLDFVVNEQSAQLKKPKSSIN